MEIPDLLKERSRGHCELCNASDAVEIYSLPPATEASSEHSLVVCNTCLEQINDPEKTDPNHWRCLNDSMWSEHEPVKIMVWRMLTRLKSEGWPQDLLDMLYLDDDTLAFAKSGIAQTPEATEIHKDSNGAELQNGDNVVLIKDLNVKGAGFTAKRGTAVRRITLVHDNPEQIEGKVEGQHIVILTKYVKKS